MQRLEFALPLDLRARLWARQVGPDGIGDQHQAVLATPVADGVQASQRADGLFVNSGPSLLVGARRAIVWQRRDDFHVVPREKLGQISVRARFEDGQVTAVDDVAPACPELRDEPTKMRVQLGRAASDVDGRDLEAIDRFEAKLHRLASHDLGAVRACVDVTV